MSSSGKIVQIIGAVVDVEFPRDQIPKVYDALKIDDGGLTLEVQQELGDGIVRTTPSPSCCCTSSVSPTSFSFSASYTRGMDSRGNCTSMTAPMIWVILPSA